MRLHSARGILPACMAVGAALALAAPGSALAKEVTQCSGINIEAKGASLQKIVQQNIWTPAFNTSTSKYACNGTQGTLAKPTVIYTSTGSGAGLRSWGIESKEPSEIKFGATNAFIASDDPPSAKQIKEVEAQESVPTPGTVLTIPIVQASEPIIMHLPAGCTATSTASTGKLVIGDAELQGIFAGTVTKWGELKAGGDELKGAGCNEAKIQPVVRFDPSGTTHIFMKFLGQINSSPLVTEKGSLTWNELSEGSLNTTWPTAAGVLKPAKNGNGEVVKIVAETAGTVAYTGLADARASKAFSEGGAGSPTFWAPLEMSSKGGKAKFAEPSTNGEVPATGTSNCKKTVYGNGANPFPPPSVTEPWNEVSAKTVQKTYPLCGFSFIITSTKYSLLPGTSAPEVQAVRDYLKFLIEKKGGQPLASAGDYEALPTTVQKIGKAGIDTIAF